MKKIGKVRSVFKQKFATPRQSGLVPLATAEIVLEDWVQAEQSLDGLDSFSHVWVIFQFHENKERVFQSKVQPPRAGGKRFGVFATRSPHRPNSIGLSVVKLEGIDGNVIRVSGVDFVEDTPVLDIKPYHPEADCIPNASPGWTAALESPKYEVSWAREAREGIGPRAVELIEQTLALDPRPTVYKEEHRKKEFTASIAEYQVRFRYLSNGISVLSVES